MGLEASFREIVRTGRKVGLPLFAGAVVLLAPDQASASRPSFGSDGSGKSHTRKLELGPGDELFLGCAGRILRLEGQSGNKLFYECSDPLPRPILPGGQEKSDGGRRSYAVLLRTNEGAVVIGKRGCDLNSLPLSPRLSKISCR